MILAVFLLLSGNAAGESASFELMDTPESGQWADFSLSRDGKSMGCLLDDAVYWWTSETGFRLLDRGVMNRGRVGMSADGGSLIAAKTVGLDVLPAIWRGDGSCIELGALKTSCDPDHPADGGFDINADGSVAVGQAASCETDVAFVWTPKKGLDDLLTPGKADSRGAAVSADGLTVVGFIEHPDKGFRRPAMWRGQAEPVLFLGTDRAGEAVNISLNGRYVVGQANLGGPSPQAFYWREGSQPVSLGNLSGRATDSSLARAVSDDGKVVGWSGDAMWGEQEAFIWTRNAGMQSLSSYLAGHGVKVPREIVLTSAVDISGDGRTVVGICRDADWNQGYWRASLGESTPAVPLVQGNPWEPRPMDPVLPDTIEISPADMLNPFPFGRRRYMP